MGGTLDPNSILNLFSTSSVPAATADAASTTASQAGQFDPFSGNTMAPVQAATPADASSAIAAGKNLPDVTNQSIWAGNTLSGSGSGGSGGITGWLSSPKVQEALKSLQSTLGGGSDGKGGSSTPAPAAQQVGAKPPQVQSAGISQGNASALSNLVQMLMSRRRQLGGYSSSGTSSRGLLG